MREIGTISTNRLLHLVAQANYSAEAQALLNRFAVEQGIADANTDARDICRRVKAFAEKAEMAGGAGAVSVR